MAAAAHIDCARPLTLRGGDIEVFQTCRRPVSAPVFMT
jgi:hypothetical protein